MRRAHAGKTLWLLCLLAPACAPDFRDASTPAPPVVANQPNLLSGHTIEGSPGVQRAERLSDGALAPQGDYWNTPLTTILPSAEAFVTIDLGQPVAIAAAIVQADNNDRYLLSGSLDGQSFTAIWVAPAVNGAGLRMRKADDLKAQARYLRLSASGGDGAYSVSELQVYSQVPSVWPAAPAANVAAEGPQLTEWILFLGVTCVLFLLAGCHGHRRRGLIAGALPVAAVGLLLSQLDGARPFVDRDIAFLRLTVALVALLAIARPFMLRRLGPVNGQRITAMLGLLAVTAVACFFNLGRAQFWDAKLREPSYVHNYDMRVYFPVAKYFHELQYDGVYLASVAAYIDNTPGQSVRTLADVELRDLHTHEMRRVRDVASQVETIHERFTPERWTEFRRDMRYFHETMGRDYFSTLSDHGGNATPVWLMVAHFIFAHASASNGTLLATAMLDPLLLLLFAVVIGRTFGVRTAFICLIVFGANDFYMFGTNWAGSTLRNDWMVALGLGAAALKTKRWYLGGALLAYAGLIRAFPAIAVLGLMVPPLWWVYDTHRTSGRWPSRAAFVRAHEGTLRALLAVAVTVVVLVGLSSAMLSPGAWLGWAKKAAVLTSGYHVNHISLRSVVAADTETWDTMQDWLRRSGRVILYALAAITFAALTLRAERGRPPQQAGLIAMFLIPIVSYPANYYFHFVFLLPLLATTEGQRRQDVWLWAVLLAMCVAEYPATFAETLAGHFVAESAVLLSAFLVLLVLLARDAGAPGAPETDVAESAAA